MQETDGGVDGIACKITLPINQLTDNLQFKLSPLKINKKNLIEHWGEKDGNLIVSKIFATHIIYNKCKHRFESIIRKNLGY